MTDILLPRNAQGEVELDRSLAYPPYSAVCAFCQRNTGFMQCAAFPERIPDEIWLAQNDHTQPYPGDHGLLFLPIQEESTKGGPGSGNFSHAGRPGKVGGSAVGSHKSYPVIGQSSRIYPFSQVVSAARRGAGFDDPRFAAAKVDSPYCPERLKDIVCSYAPMAQPFRPLGQPYGVVDSDPEAGYYRKFSGYVDKWLSDQEALGANPLGGIKKIVLTISPDEFNYIGGDLTLRADWAEPDKRKEMKKDYGMQPGNDEWQGQAMGIGRREYGNAAAFYDARTGVLVMRPIDRDKPFYTLSKMDLRTGQKKVIRHSAQRVFTHECGHAVHQGSKKKDEWDVRYESYPRLDRKTRYSRTSLHEGFAESYVSFLALIKKHGAEFKTTNTWDDMTFRSVRAVVFNEDAY